VVEAAIADGKELGTNQNRLHRKALRVIGKRQPRDRETDR
jgi:hypothetical protein